MNCQDVKSWNENIFGISKSNTKCYCSSNSLDYYHEMEEYKSKLKESHNLINKQEAELSLIKEQYRRDILKLNDDISKYKEKFERLYESHKRISRLNHDLEEKTLSLIDTFNFEKSKLESNFKETVSKYQSSQSFLTELQGECERYRNDCMLAVQLLQNNPNHFIARNVHTLPLDLKERLMYLEHGIEINNSLGAKLNLEFRENDLTKSYVPIFTYPPTTMIFSDRSNNKRCDQVCPSMLAQILHPDQNCNQTFKQNKIMIDMVCNICGHVIECRDAGVQTIPEVFLQKNYTKNVQDNIKKDQNLVFDV